MTEPKTKKVNQPSTRKPETRRKQAIQKIYQYLGMKVGMTIRLPVFRARLINDAISYEQFRSKTGLSDKAIKAVSEACGSGDWEGVKHTHKIRAQLQKVFRFTDADFVTKAYTVDDMNWLFVEA